MLLTSSTFQACKSRHDANENKIQTSSVVSKNAVFPAGQVIDSVVCKKDSSQSYALYLPCAYSVEKKYPIIYAFDPHSSGKIPVSLYKKLAEEYGFIIVGSNNSKNGTTWEDSQTIAGKLFADTENRLSINTARIYALGFSGGARVANALTITNGSIAGVICCGASAPVANSIAPRNNYSFYGIVGIEDFNYTEMRKYDMVDLAGHNVKHVLSTFNGKHEWPNEDIMEEAFWWLDLNEMRKNNSYKKNDSLISIRLQASLKQVEAFQKQKMSLYAFRLCQKIINFYDGLADLSSCYANYKSGQSDPEIDKELKLEEIQWSEEESLKQNYIKALQTQNLAWWNKNIASINQKIKTDKDKNKVLINKRLLSFLSLASYMQTTNALNQNMLPAADFFCKIYLLVDPTNSEAHYLMADIFSKNGNKTEAVKSLNLAIKNGFIDLVRLQSDEAFKGIKNTKEFADMIKDIK
jgi:dienelactone hydrolase